MTVTEFLKTLVPPPVVVSDERFEVRRGDVTIACGLRLWKRRGKKVREWRCWTATTTPVGEIDNLIAALKTTRMTLLALKQFEDKNALTCKKDN